MKCFVSFNNSVIIISVDVAPIIENIFIKGIKAKNWRNYSKTLVKRSSFNNLLSDEKQNIEDKLRELGFYFAEVDTYIDDLNNNIVAITNKIKLGEKSRIKKISFLGNKIFKDRKLRGVIISEEYKFWKFLSGKKFLNEEIIAFDQRLLKNFYLNRGYYNVQINTSFAKILENNEFELIYNIDPGEKFFFGDLTLNLPSDFKVDNFDDLNEFLINLKGERYSINSVEKILDKIDLITISEEFKSVKASRRRNWWQ